MSKLNVYELHELVVDYFDYKLSQPILNSEKNEVCFVLYDSFLFKFSIDERYENFKAALLISSEMVLINVLGEVLPINNDRASILVTCEKADRYCKLRLPDKFLTAYDEAYID